MGDKPATRKGIMALDISRLPLVRGVQTCADFVSQAGTVRLSPLKLRQRPQTLIFDQFLQMLNEDGSIGDR